MTTIKITAPVLHARDHKQNVVAALEDLTKKIREAKKETFRTQGSLHDKDGMTVGYYEITYSGEVVTLNDEHRQQIRVRRGVRGWEWTFVDAQVPWNGTFESRDAAVRDAERYCNDGGAS